MNYLKQINSIVFVLLFVVFSFSSSGFARESNEPKNRLPSLKKAEALVDTQAAYDDLVTRVLLGDLPIRVEYEDLIVEDVVVFADPTGYFFGIDNTIDFLETLAGAGIKGYHRIEDIKSLNGGKYITAELTFVLFSGVDLDSSTPIIAFQCIFQYRRVKHGGYKVENAMFVNVGTDVAGVTGQPFTINGELNPVYKHNFSNK